MKTAAGVDIGGTKTTAGVVGPDGSVLCSVTAPTPAAAGPRAVLDTAARLATEVMAAASAAVACWGVGTTGTVGRDGVISHSTAVLPGWAGTDLRAELGHRVPGLPPPVVVNDVHAAAVGESRHGAAAGASTALVVAVGTGIGGAVVCDGRIVLGGHGVAGRVGHLPVPATRERRCACGLLGHLEAYASGPAIAAAYAERAGLAAAPELEEVGRLASGGVGAAAEVIAEASGVLGRGLAGLAHVIDPDVIVLAGGVTRLGEMFLDPLRQVFLAQLLPGSPDVPVAQAVLGAHAAVVGAATLAQEEQSP